MMDKISKSTKFVSEKSNHYKHWSLYLLTISIIEAKYAMINTQDNQCQSEIPTKTKWDFCLPYTTKHWKLLEKICKQI